MSVIVLLSTVSFTVDTHYCGDTLVDMALFKGAKTCKMQQAVASQTCGDTMNKMSCCKDKKVVFEGQDELKDSVIQLTFEQQTFIVSYFYTYVHLFKDVETTITSFVGHPPPKLHKDFQVLYETFLI